jgi:L-ascorbate metabolism protein UlaG (beta-lactamase superfamily)
MTSGDMDDLLFLRDDVKVEPLVAGWYAWPHLIAPAQNAMNIVGRQLPMLKSFVANPKVHIAACRNPALLGGPFVDLGLEHVPHMKALIAHMESECAPQIRFAGEYKTLERKLLASAQGYCLDDYYGELPPSLQGLVELAYDLSNRPRIRLFEELVYRSEIANTPLQGLCLYEQPDTTRPFFLNVPQFGRPDRLRARKPFSDPVFGALGNARTVGCRPRALFDELGFAQDQWESFRALFTPKPPLRKEPHYTGDGVRVRYFGHACVLLQTRDTSVLIDPLFAFDERSGGSGLTFSDLPDRIDYVVISHAHQDHLCAEMLLQLRDRVDQVLVPRGIPGELADPSMKLILKALGFASVTAVDPFDTVRLADGVLILLPFPGEQCGLDIQAKQCIGVELRGRKFLFMVDSDAVDRSLYERLARHFHDVDAVFLGMECHGAPVSWFYGPLMSGTISREDDGSRRANGSESTRAWAALRQIGCQRAYVYAMGMEPWTRYLLGLEYTAESVQIRESNRLVQLCRDAGIEAERLKGSRDWIIPAARSVSVTSDAEVAA